MTSLAETYSESGTKYSQGCQIPPILIPSKVPSKGSFGEPAFDLAHASGLTLDPWQKTLLSDWLKFDYRGKWCALDCGLVVSRQNGKGALLEARALFALFQQPGCDLVIWTAHEVNTALEGFKRIRQLIEQTPFLMKQVRKIMEAQGKEGIELRNGRRLLFKARSKGGARGFTCDVLFLDEAMFLTEEQMRAIYSALSAVPNPQIIFTGSAGWKDSVGFGRLRNNSLKGRKARGHFAEWSLEMCGLDCMPDCTVHIDPMSHEAAWLTNPGLGKRVTWEFVQSEQGNYDLEGFAQERLGVGTWPTDGESWSVVDEERYRRCHDPSPTKVAKSVSFAVDITPDRSYSSISVGFRTEEGKKHGELTRNAQNQWDHGPGDHWVLPRLIELAKKHRAPVIIDPATQALWLEEPLKAAGVEVIRANTRDYGEACASLVAAIQPKGGGPATFSHSDQALVTAAFAGAGKREVGEFWMWDRGESHAEITPLVSLTLAVWGVDQPRKNNRAVPFARRLDIER